MLWVDTGEEADGDEGSPTNFTLLLENTVLRGRVALSPRGTSWRAQGARRGRGRQLGTRRARQGGQWSRREVQEQGRQGEVKEGGLRVWQAEQEAEEELEEWEVAVVQVQPGGCWAAAMSARPARTAWRRRCQ